MPVMIYKNTKILIYFIQNAKVQKYFCPKMQKHIYINVPMYQCPKMQKYLYTKMQKYICPNVQKHLSPLWGAGGLVSHPRCKDANIPLYQSTKIPLYQNTKTQMYICTINH